MLNCGATDTIRGMGRASALAIIVGVVAVTAVVAYFLQARSSSTGRSGVEVESLAELADIIGCDAYTDNSEFLFPGMAEGGDCAIGDHNVNLVRYHSDRMANEFSSLGEELGCDFSDGFVVVEGPRWHADDAPESVLQNIADATGAKLEVTDCP